MNKTIVIVSYKALPEQSELAKEAIQAVVAAVLANEPECGGITVLRNVNDPKRFTLIEHWPSQEIFLGPHMQQPHIQSFIQHATAFLAGPPDISFWHATSAA